MRQTGKHIFNIGSGKATSFNDLLALISNELGVDLKYGVSWLENLNPEFYQNYTCANLDKAKELKFKPQFDIEKGVKQYIGIMEGNNGTQS